MSGATPEHRCWSDSGAEPKGEDCIHPLPPASSSDNQDGVPEPLQGSHPMTHPLRGTQKSGLLVCVKAGPLQMRFYLNCHTETQA